MFSFFIFFEFFFCHTHLFPFHLYSLFNKMSSSNSNNSNSYHGDRRLTRSIGMGVVNCKCGIEAGVWPAWKSGTKNPGRRFYGCSRFRDIKSCNFFMWRDPEYTDRGREVIMELVDELSRKREEIELLKKRLEMLEEVQINGGDCVSRLENLEKTSSGIKLGVRLIICSCVIVVILLLCNMNKS